MKMVMMDSLKDLLDKKAKLLDKDSQRDVLRHIQHELDRLFDGKARAQRVDMKTKQLFVHVSSSVTATIVRYSHTQIMASVRDVCDPPIERLVVQIRHDAAGSTK